MGQSTLRWRTALIAVVVLALVGSVVWWVVKQMSSSSKPQKKGIQEIALIKPPPPPPPPPPKVEPPKLEPPKMDMQDKVEAPKDASPKPDAPPPGPDLAVDAAGTGNGDSFGIVGKKGGADLIGGSGGGGNKFAWYGALIKDRIQDALLKDKKLREASDLRILVNVWINATGAVTRVDLLGTSSDVDLDNNIKAVLRNLPPLREGAPIDMPQPIRLRITAR
jgi:protein TonB